MFLVGLTGGISTGKSTVSSYLAEHHDIALIDTDRVARQVVEPGTRGHKKVVAAFGSEILLRNGGINRTRLGAIVFADNSKRQTLQRIVWPEVYRSVLLSVILYLFRGRSFVVIDTPMLFESGSMVKFLRSVIVVHCSPEAQLSRLCNRDQCTGAEAEKKIYAQMSQEEKKSRATYFTLPDNARVFQYHPEWSRKFRQLPVRRGGATESFSQVL